MALQGATSGATLQVIALPSWFMPAIFSAALAWLIRRAEQQKKSVDSVIEEVRGMKQELFGFDGRNGLKSRINDACDDIESIHERHTAEDAVAFDRNQRLIQTPDYRGPDRRTQGRRVTDRRATDKAASEQSAPSFDEGREA